MNKRTIYSAELKIKIVLKLLNDEETINEISSKYKINQSILRKWKTEAINSIHSRFTGNGNIKTIQKEHDMEIETLNKKISNLETEIDWLKKNLVKLLYANKIVIM